MLLYGVVAKREFGRKIETTKVNSIGLANGSRDERKLDIERSAPEERVFCDGRLGGCFLILEKHELVTVSGESLWNEYCHPRIHSVPKSIF